VAQLIGSQPSNTSTIDLVPKRSQARRQPPVTPLIPAQPARRAPA